MAKIPKEVTITEAEFKEQEEVWESWYICPSCKAEWITTYFHFCPICGVKLNWAITDKEDPTVL